LLFLVSISVSVSGYVKPDTSYVGLYMKNLYDLRPEEYSYSADFWLWFNSTDTTSNPLENIEIVNAKQTTYTDASWSPVSGGLANETGRATLIHDWKSENYPFDKQYLRIDLEANLDTTKMILLPAKNGFGLYSELLLPGWKISSHRIRLKTIRYDSDFGDKSLSGKSAYSRIIYEIEIKRHRWGLFLKLFVGVYVSFLVNFMAFFLPPARDQRFGLSIGGLFAAIANKYVMDSNIPVSVSFSYVDQVHVLTFIFILLTLILSVVSLKISKNNQHHGRERFDRNCAILVGLSYVVLNATLVIVAIRS